MSDGSMMGGMGALGEMVGSLVGEAIAAGDMEKARAIAYNIARKYADMPLPKILKMYPELQGDTAFNGVQADAKYTSVEDQALSQMMKRANGGMGPEDDANIMRARLEGQQQAQASSGSIDREARRRGMTGSGVAGKQLAAQQGANRTYQGGMQAAGDASQRALQALSMGSQYASSLAGRDLNQRNMTAGARDRISEFNLGRKDKTQQYNNEIGQRQFENSLTKLGGETEGMKLYMDQINARGQASRRIARGTGKAAGTLVGMAGS